MSGKQSPIRKTEEEISKMTLDESKLNAITVPNPALAMGIPGIGVHKVPKQLVPMLLLNHPALPRAIDIKSNNMFNLIDDNLERNIIVNKKGSKGKESNSNMPTPEEAADYCKTILDNSGGPVYVKDLVVGTYRFGTSNGILQQNKAKTEVLRFEHQHELFFGPARWPTIKQGKDVKWDNIPRIEREKLFGKIKIDPKTKKISKFTQFTLQSEAEKDGKNCGYPGYGFGYGDQYGYESYGHNSYPVGPPNPYGNQGQYKNNYDANTGVLTNTMQVPNQNKYSSMPICPVGPEFDQRIIQHLLFDRMGDEQLGIPLVQTIQLVINDLLGIERAGAQSTINFGFNKYVANTPYKNGPKMQEFAASLASINTDAVVVLPADIDMKNIEPSQVNLDVIHAVYINLIAMRTGIPVPILTGQGRDTNKASIESLRQEMFGDFKPDEVIFERSLNDAFFKACQIKWSRLTIVQLDMIVPTFRFNLPKEDQNVIADRELKTSLSVRNYSDSAKIFWGIGMNDLAIKLGAKVNTILNRSFLLDGNPSDSLSGNALPEGVKEHPKLETAEQPQLESKPPEKK